MPVQRSPISSFLFELKSRSVFRVAMAYSVASWVVIQVAVNIFPYLRLPAWTVTAVILLSILGLPVALLLSWAFDLTPEGLRWTETPEPATASDPLHTGEVHERKESAPAPTAVTAPPSASCVAVLPLANLSADPDNEYFTDGITEDILTQLAKISRLRVISRTSVMPYKRTDKSIAVIGAELGAAYILEGTVRRAGERLRITAQLIDSRTDEHLWAEHYDRELKDVFAVQTEIACAIASSLKARLRRAESERVEAVPTSNLEAYDLYLRARDYLRRKRREDNRIAGELARRAIDLDPTFAAAYALLSAVYQDKINKFGDDPQWLDKSKALAEQALTIDPGNGKAHGALGGYYLLTGKLLDSVAEYERATELDPGNGSYPMNLGICNARMGRPDEAVRWFQAALAVEPGRSDEVHHNLSAAYWDLGLTERAEFACRSSLALRPDFPLARSMSIQLAVDRGDLARALKEAQELLASDPSDAKAIIYAGEAFLYAGRLADASHQFQEACRLAPTSSGSDLRATVLLGYTRWKLGDQEGASVLFREFEGTFAEYRAEGGRSYGMLLSQAAVYSIEKKIAEGLLILREAIAEGGLHPWVLEHHPLLENLRSDPEFEKIISSVKSRYDVMRRRVDREGW